MRATVSAKIRLVRCPKCRHILPEYPDIPVYKCGGCGTRLQVRSRAEQNVKKRELELNEVRQLLESDYRLQGEWAQAKRVLQQERDNVTYLRSECELTLRNARSQVAEMGNAISAAVAEVLIVLNLFCMGEWAQTKTVLQQERDNVRSFRSECEQTIGNARRQVEEMGNAVSAAETRAAVAEEKFEMELKKHADDEKSARDEVHHLSESVCRLQGEWAQAKTVLQQERDNVTSLRSECEQTKKNAERKVEEMEKELANALHAVQAAATMAAAAETRAAVAEEKFEMELKTHTDDAKRARDEVHHLSESVYRLQSSLDAIQSTEEVRQGEWAQAKTVLQQERDSVRSECEQTIRNAMRKVEEMGNAVSAVETRAAVAEKRAAEVNKLVELYKESSEEWSRKAGELEGVIKALEIGKDGEIERLSMEVSELHKSNRQLSELVDHKNLDISQKNATINDYHAQIVNLTGTASEKEACLSEIEAELARSQAELANALNAVQAAETRATVAEEATKKAQEKAAMRLKSLEEDLEKSRNDIVSLQSERDKLALDAKSSRDRFDGLMGEFKHQRQKLESLRARNEELSQLNIDYQKEQHESSEAFASAEEHSRKLSMEVSVLKHEKEMLSNAKKRVCNKVCHLSGRVYRLRRGWAQAKKELQQERDNVRSLKSECEQTMNNATRQVEEMGNAVLAAETTAAAAEERAAAAEVKLADVEKKIATSDPKAYE